MGSPRFDAEVTARGTGRASVGALEIFTRGDWPPCMYERHRSSDWRLKDSTLVVCGICHPPVAPADQVVRVGEAS